MFCRDGRLAAHFTISPQPGLCYPQAGQPDRNGVSVQLERLQGSASSIFGDERRWIVGEQPVDSGGKRLLLVMK